MSKSPGSQLDAPREEEYTLTGFAPSAFRVLSTTGGVLLVASVLLGLFVGGDAGMRHFFLAYLTGYMFFLSITLGSLFFLAAYHATRAGWSVALRRIFEILAGNIGLLAVLFLPILLPVLWGNHDLYPWTDPDVVAADELLQHKAAYLNTVFFAIRCVLYFGVWWALVRFFRTRSLRQDESGDPALTNQAERVAGPALLLFALTVTFASFDWMMSLEPDWFSTIFGLYFASGAAVASAATAVLCAAFLQSKGRLTEFITTEHYHDLGKLLLATVVFWGYMAFSQYLLIWYANIPEETVWYQHRLTGFWGWVATLLLFGHLLIPFLGLLPRAVKRTRGVLAFWAVWLLAFHWLDLAWLIIPVNETQSPVSLTSVLIFFGLACQFAAGMIRLAGTHALVPLKDPRLGEALAFENQ